MVLAQQDSTARICRYLDPAIAKEKILHLENNDASHSPSLPADPNDLIRATFVNHDRSVHSQQSASNCYRPHYHLVPLEKVSEPLANQTLSPDQVIIGLDHNRVERREY